MSWRRFFAILLGIALLFLAAEVFVARRANPPQEAQTLVGWLTWQPDANRFFIAQDGAHLMALGRGGGLLPSGPAVYVFDAQSQLVAWTPDLGDDPDFARRWSIRYPLPLVDRVQAQEWANQSRQSRVR